MLRITTWQAQVGLVRLSCPPEADPSFGGKTGVTQEKLGVNCLNTVVFYNESF